MFFPPYCDIVMLLMQGEDENSIIKELVAIATKLKGKCHAMLGPVAAPYARIKNKYRWRILLKCRDTNKLLPFLQTILQEHSNSENNLTIDINPNSMN